MPHSTNPSSGAEPAESPGASGPGEPGYDGAVTVGDDAMEGRLEANEETDDEETDDEVPSDVRERTRSRRP